MDEIIQITRPSYSQQELENNPENYDKFSSPTSNEESLKKSSVIESSFGKKEFNDRLMTSVHSNITDTNICEEKDSKLNHSNSGSSSKSMGYAEV